MEGRRTERAWRRWSVLLAGLVLAAILPLRAGAAPLSVDLSSFPTIRLYLPAGSTVPAALTEDGRPVVPLPKSSTVPRAPLLGALVLDTSGSMEAALPEIQAAAGDLVQRLGPKDRLALLRFSSDVEVLSPPTADRAALLHQIGTLRADGATALYDAVWAGVEQAQTIDGTGLRAVILLTDGKDEGEGPDGTPGSAMRFEPLRQRLLSLRLPVFILGLGKDVDRDVLTGLADASGGKAFFADQPGDVHQLLDTVAGTLLAVQSVEYVSPQPKPDGSTRHVTGRDIGPSSGSGTGSDGAAGTGSAGALGSWQVSYVAPKDGMVLWRWPVTVPNVGAGERRRAMCGVGAVSPGGTWVLAYGPLTLLHGDGHLEGAIADRPPFRPERASILDDSSGVVFGGASSALYSVEPEGVAADASSPTHWVALSPSGAVALRLTAAAKDAAAVLAAVDAVTDTPLWSVPCPGTTCDRLAGAAVSDAGVAFINQTGTLYRISAGGKLMAGPPEVFFGPVSVSADGKRAAAVVWQGSRNAPGMRAEVLDEALHPIETVPVVGANPDVPPVASVSPGGLYAAVLDDTRLVGTVLGEPGDPVSRTWKVLAHPAATPAPCDRTLQIDDLGNVLVSDGDGLALLRGFSQP
jgi:von Willebrand factor type A domain